MASLLKVTWDDLIWGRSNFGHLFVTTKPEETADVAHAFADVILAEQRSGDWPLRIFNLGMLGHRGTGKTLFTDAMLTKGGPLEKQITFDHAQFEGVSRDFGKVVRGDSMMKVENYPMLGDLRHPWLVYWRHLRTKRGLDIVEHPAHLKFRDYFHTLVTIRRDNIDPEKPEETQDRKIVFMIPPVLNRRASVQTFLARASAFYRDSAAPD